MLRDGEQEEAKDKHEALRETTKISQKVEEVVDGPLVVGFFSWQGHDSHSQKMFRVIIYLHERSLNLLANVVEEAIKVVVKWV